MSELLETGPAIVRVRVEDQVYHSRIGITEGTVQYSCYAALTLRIDETILGDLAGNVTLAQNSCPGLVLGKPSLMIDPLDPPLFAGREYVLLLSPGDDSTWEITAFPEGHSAAGAHYHLDDPSAQFELVDGRIEVNPFAKEWARGLIGATVDEFKSYLANPEEIPSPPRTEQASNKN